MKIVPFDAHSTFKPYVYIDQLNFQSILDQLTPAHAVWDNVVLPAGVCTSGEVDALANTYGMTCRFAIVDNDHEIPSAHQTRMLFVARSCTLPMGATRHLLARHASLAGGTTRPAPS